VYESAAEWQAGTTGFFSIAILDLERADLPFSAGRRLNGLYILPL